MANRKECALALISLSQRRQCHGRWQREGCCQDIYPDALFYPLPFRHPAHWTNTCCEPSAHKRNRSAHPIKLEFLHRWLVLSDVFKLQLAGVISHDLVYALRTQPPSPWNASPKPRNTSPNEIKDLAQMQSQGTPHPMQIQWTICIKQRPQKVPYTNDSFVFVCVRWYTALPFADVLV